jgi:HK97 family phage prohead protease
MQPKQYIPEIKHKAFPVAQFKVADKGEGIIEAIVAVFNNEDRGGEIIREGFFALSLQKKLPKGVWMHDWTQPVARTIEARELSPGDPLLPEKLKELGGAYIKGQFNLGTQRGREAFSDIEFGIVDEFSIGFMPTKWLYNEETEVVELIEGEWFEWSPVLVGMNPETYLMNVKALEDGSLAGLKLGDHSGAVLAAAKGLLARLEDLAQLKKKDERKFAASNRELLQEMDGVLERLQKGAAEERERVKALLQETAPRAKAPTIVQFLRDDQALRARLEALDAIGEH